MQQYVYVECRVAALRMSALVPPVANGCLVFEERDHAAPPNSNPSTTKALAKPENGS
ncbi:MAG: hypothetical protein ABIP49_04305 [Lysobacterales bacterium]